MAEPPHAAGTDLTHQTVLDPTWMSALLGVPVEAISTTPIGSGQMAASLRLDITYAGAKPITAPATLVAKVPSDDPQSRATGVAMGSYNIETSFYRDLAAGLPVRTPKCWHVGFDTATHDFVLVLEDMAPAVQGDQLRGCTPDEAELAVRELPKLHAPRWGDATLEALGWLPAATPMRAGMVAQLVTSVFPGFCDRYGDRLDADVVELCGRLLPMLAAHLAGGAGPKTVQHGDYRLDNLLFGGPGATAPVAVVDWQTVVLGPGVADLSYFIGAGLVPEDRRSHETDLVRIYHEALNAAEVELSWDECWKEYRRHSVAGVVMAIVASMVVGQTDRGDEMFIAMAQRHGRHALDMEAESVLGD